MNWNWLWDLNLNLEAVENVAKWVALFCFMAIWVTLIGFVQTVHAYRKEARRRYRKTESEKRLGRERL